MQRAISDFFGMEVEEGMDNKGTQGNLAMTEVFVVLIIVIISWIHTHVKTDQIVTSNMWSLLFYNYTSIKL